MYELVNSFAEIEESTLREFKKNCTIYFEEIASSMIDFINITGIDTLTHSEEFQISALSILRKLIEIENKEEKAFEDHIPCYDWNPDNWDDYKYDVE